MSHGRFHSHGPQRQRAPRARSTDDATMLLWADAPDVLGRIGPGAPMSAAGWHERGIEQELAGDGPSAIRSYLRALAVGGPDAQIAFDLACAFAVQGDTSRALARYRQTLELNPLHTDAWINLGDLLADAGEIDAAIECFRHAVELSPRDAAAHYNLADTLEAAGEPNAARPHWASFVALSEGPAEHVLHAKSRLTA